MYICVCIYIIYMYYVLVLNPVAPPPLMIYYFCIPFDMPVRPMAEHGRMDE